MAARPSRWGRSISTVEETARPRASLRRSGLEEKSAQGHKPPFRLNPATVCFTPESGHWRPRLVRPLRATRRSKRTDNAVIIALRLAKPHTNARGNVHGGLISALADNAMGYSCGQAIGWASSLATITLVDFTGIAQIGQ